MRGDFRRAKEHAGPPRERAPATTIWLTPLAFALSLCFSFRFSQWGIVPPILLLQAVLKINATMSKAQEAQRAAGGETH